MFSGGSKRDGENGKGVGQQRRHLKELKKTIQTYIPYGEIPIREKRFVSKTWYYYGPDSAQLCKENPHPLYGPGDIEYVHNKRGYRCPEFDVEADFKIVSLGCSMVYGIGLPEHELFPTKIAKNLAPRFGNIVNWNLGYPLGSNDTISRLLIAAVETLHPDLVLINFTYLPRCEYYSADGLFDCNPHSVKSANDLAIWINSHNGFIQVYKAYKLAESILESRNIEWFWSLVTDELLLIKNRLLMDKYAGIFSINDTARDHRHPGPKSNDLICDKYMEKINKVWSV
jgi:hypothetical protein